MKLVTHLNQGTDAWKLWRREGLGGSDAATVLGVAPFADATLENLLREKVEGWERPVNYAMKCGTRWEPVARDLYQRKARCVATPVCAIHDHFPWARVSLDGLCSNGAALPSERIHWLLELKCPGWEAHDWALAGVVPPYYLPQCQWQMFVTGIQRLDYCSYYGHEDTKHNRFGPPGHPDRFVVLPVEPDPEMQDLLLEKCGEFWRKVEELRAERRKVAGGASVAC